MGLVLGVWRNERLYFGNDWVRIAEVTGQQEFVVENADGTAYTIEGDEGPNGTGIEVLPEVFIRAAPKRADAPPTQARVFIEAPREIKILRERQYKEVGLYEDARDSIMWLISVIEDQAEPVGVSEAIEDACEVVGRLETAMNPRK